MKKVIMALALLFLIAAASQAQTSSNMKDSMMMKMTAFTNGVKMIGMKPMLCTKKKCVPLTSTFTCDDGCTVSTDGTVTKPDGSSMKLMDGYQIDNKGEVSMIPHGQKGHVCSDKCPMYKKM